MSECLLIFIIFCSISISISKPKQNPRLREIGCTEGKCFYTDTDTNGLSFIDALEYCQRLGLFPATVTSATQNSVVLSGQGPYRPFWLPLTDIGSEGNFRWIRTGEPIAFKDWISGHPSEDERFQDVTNCVYISGSNNGSWLNLPCYTIWRPLCEFP